MLRRHSRSPRSGIVELQPQLRPYGQLEPIGHHIYTVFMLADAAAAATLEGSKATATAFIDPVFSFGLGLDSTSYSFLFRAGIGNALPPVAAAPEGGTLAPLIAGCVALSLLRGSRRTQQGQ